MCSQPPLITHLSSVGSPQERRQQRGLSQIEILITVAILGVIASIAFIAAPDVADSARITKLESDVTTINTAIRVYLASGGDLSSVTAAQAVLDKLKTRRDSASADLYVGLDESMLDKRLAAQLQTESEAATTDKRALWDASQNRFVLATNGSDGVAKFYLNELLATVDYGIEDRAGSLLNFNPNDGWIWAYEDGTSTPPPGPTVIPVDGTGTAGEPTAGSDTDGGDTSGDTAGDSGGDSADSGDPLTPQQLLPPVFSIAQEYHPITAFPLQLTFQNPNPIGSSQVIYSLQGGAFQGYSGAITIPPNTQVLAQVVSLNAQEWSDSAPAAKFYQPVLLSIAGNLSARFQNPIGPPGMVQNISNGSSSSQFLWGQTTYIYNGQWYDLGPQNSLVFSGQSFQDANPGDSISVGTLDYYNGSILDGSQVESVDLIIDVNVTSPLSLTLTVPYTFELINTVNDAADPTGSADIVRIQSGSSFADQVIDGVRYQIELTFGNSTANGFTSIDQFHVLEGASASAELRAVYTPIPVDPLAGQGAAQLLQAQADAASAAAVTEDTTGSLASKILFAAPEVK